MNLLPKPLAYTIMGLVTLVWAINFGAQFFIESYQSDPLIHGIFMGIVGGAFALTRKSESKPPDPPAAPAAPPPPASPPAPAPPQPPPETP